MALRLEALEDRTVLAGDTWTWTGGGGADHRASTTANWIAPVGIQEPQNNGWGKIAAVSPRLATERGRRYKAAHQSECSAVW